MKFSTKLFFAILVPSLLGIGGLSMFFCQSFIERTADSFNAHYGSITRTLGTTLFELEKKSEALMSASLATLDAKIRINGPPSNTELSRLAGQLGVSQLYVTNGAGKFIRSTKEDPKELPNIFSFCPTYESTFRANGDFLPTGIMPGIPSGLPHKFLLRSSSDRRFVLEAGIHADYIGRTLQEAVKADSNIEGIQLLAPSGKVLASYGSTDSFTKPEKFDEHGLHVQYGKAKITYTHFFPASNKICCSCLKRGLTDGDYGYFLSVAVSRAPLKLATLQIQTFGGLAALVVAALCFLTAKLISSRLFRRIKVMNKVIADVTESKALHARLNIQGTDEVAQVAQRFDHMLDALQEKERELTDLTKTEATLKVATQLAHDIRSPLTALSVITSKTDAVPEESRVLIRSVISQIQDVANRLLQTSHSLNGSGSSLSEDGFDTLEPTLISGVVETLVSGKRIQYSSRHGIEIETVQGANSYCLFAYVDRSQLLRVLSNLIDNSIEAIQEEGRITVTIDEFEGQSRIQIADNGKGFPGEMLGRIGERGATFGKAKGNGLGIHYAKLTLERWGGSFSVSSLPGLGATVTILLQRAPTPTWFLSQIQIQRNSNIMILDDDPSIHATWDQLLAEAPQIGTKIIHFTDAGAAEDWLHKRGRPTRLLCLVDYELLRNKMTGLDFIERNGLAESSVLVTSHQDDPAILEKCKSLGVSLLPKSLVPLVPISMDLNPSLLDSAPY